MGERRRDSGGLPSTKSQTAFRHTAFLRPGGTVAVNAPDTAGAIHLGTAWYPEHWPEERWPEDVRMMREAGMTVVRLGEFAWSSLQPGPEHWDMDWLERAIALLAANGISSVLGTPTAAPPAWLVEAEPTVLAVDASGHRVQFGNRCHYCVNSPAFQTACVGLIETMGRRFGADPHVIGWQLDNEYNRTCYCDLCRDRFQAYLAQAYGSLDALNNAWSTRYWSQTYGSWAQIPVPRTPYVDGAQPVPAFHNPGLLLDFRRFVTASYRRFQRLQIDTLRPHLPRTAWVTHNFMDWHDGFDHYEMTADLDIASWDWYVGMGPHDHLASGAAHDLIRGLKRRNFWLMETQPGSVNWRPINTVTDRGEARAMAWHAIGHGADAVLYWQWRSAPGGQEQYHGSILDASGQPRPIYEEIRRLGAELASSAHVLTGTEPRARAAILNSYDSRWSIGWQPHHRDFDYVGLLRQFYRPLADRNLQVDVISADEDLTGYDLVVAPALIVMTERRASALQDYVESGGHLVLTVRTAMKDDHNALLPARQPGPLSRIAGVEVEEFFPLLDPIPVVANGGFFPDGTFGFARLWAERLRVLDPATEILACYGRSNGWLDERPAVTVRRWGDGRVYFVGACLDEPLQDLFLARVAADAGLRPVLHTPPGVEAARRVDGSGREAVVLINHDREPAVVSLSVPSWDHLAGRVVDGSIELEPYGVALLTPGDGPPDRRRATGVRTNR
jgi:beta-galactosidase